MVVAVAMNGVAAQSGIRTGDTLVAVNGASILTHDGAEHLSMMRPSDRVILTFHRAGQGVVNITIVGSWTGRGAGVGPADRAQALQSQVDELQRQLVDATFARLFDGIVLTPDQDQKVRAILAGTLHAQLASAGSADRLGVRRQLQARRDSTIGALLTNTVDRATYRTRAARDAGRSAETP